MARSMYAHKPETRSAKLLCFRWYAEGHNPTYVNARDLAHALQIIAAALPDGAKGVTVNEV